MRLLLYSVALLRLDSEHPIKIRPKLENNMKIKIVKIVQKIQTVKFDPCAFPHIDIDEAEK